jgi:hypothetical protein
MSCKARMVLVFVLPVLFYVAPVGASAQSTGSHELTLIHPEDEAFDSLLTQNFRGFQDLEDYRAVLPFMVVLRNDTSHSATAYAISWDIQSSGGMVNRLVIEFIQKHHEPKTQIRAFAPGDIRLISPIFNLSPTQYLSQRNALSQKLAVFSPLPPYSSTDIKSIKATVDAAIYDDGAYAGLDRFELLREYQCTRDAERDVAESVLKLKGSEAPVSEIVASLERDAQAGLNANTSRGERDAIYALHRGEEAQALLNLYSRRGLDSLMARAVATTQHPRENISRVSPD